MRLASNLVPFSCLRDRFVPEGYTPGHELDEQLALLSRVDGIEGVALGWPCDVKDGETLRRKVEDHGLRWAISEPNIYGEARFRMGSLSNPDPAVRAAAMDRVKDCIEHSVAGGVEAMNLWLGQDGFDYPFQGHYLDAWRRLEDGLREIAEFNTSDLTVCVEPKPKEPRALSYLASTGKVLMLLNKIAHPRLQITLDYGHSLAALEQPAEAAVLALREGRLGQVHLNDNRRDWDLDLVPGATTVWEHVEFYYWLAKLGYDGWLSADAFTWREDGTEALERVVQVHRTCLRLARRLDEDGVEDLLRQGRHLEIMKGLWEMFT